METTVQLVQALLRDLGSPTAAIDYIDRKLTAEAQGYYAGARAALVAMVTPPTHIPQYVDAVGEYNPDGTMARFSNPIRVF